MGGRALLVWNAWRRWRLIDFQEVWYNIECMIIENH